MEIKYNTEYINTHYALIKTFLSQADTNILDISYSVDKKNLSIQIVLLEGSFLPKAQYDAIEENLVGLEIEIKLLYRTKEQFNKSKGGWTPVNYSWLDFLLFSKAEVL